MSKPLRGRQAEQASEIAVVSLGGGRRRCWQWQPKLCWSRGVAGFRSEDDAIKDAFRHGYGSVTSGNRTIRRSV